MSGTSATRTPSKRRSRVAPALAISASEPGPNHHAALVLLRSFALHLVVFAGGAAIIGVILYAFGAFDASTLLGGVAMVVLMAAGGAWKVFEER